MLFSLERSTFLLNAVFTSPRLPYHLDRVLCKGGIFGDHRRSAAFRDVAD
jgi:hypothetical protein